MSKYEILAQTTDNHSLKILYQVARWQFIPNITLGIIALWACILVPRIVKFLFCLFAFFFARSKLNSQNKGNNTKQKCCGIAQKTKKKTNKNKKKQKHK